MLNIDELIIVYNILNHQINKMVIRIVLCYPITNLAKFEFVYFDSFIICVVFRLANILKYMLLTRPMNSPLIRDGQKNLRN